MNSLFFWSTVISAISLGFLLGRANANIGREKMEEEFDVKKEKFKKEKDQLNNENIRLSSIVDSTQIDRHRSFKGLEVGEIFLCVKLGGWFGEKEIQYRSVIRTPANKFQIVKVEKDGTILCGTDKPIASTLEEIIRTISEAPEYFRKRDL